MKRLLAVAATTAVAAGAITIGLVAPSAGAADAATSATSVAKAVPAGRADARLLLDALPTRKESHSASYSRARFEVWNDADGDGEDTRAEVLRTESRITPSVSSHHTVKGGRWISAYDNVVVSKAARLDVDHLVPLAEAWRSGAWKWSAKQREAFGNDLGYGPSLIAVTLSSNRSKGDSDPASWMPEASSYACAYVKHWIGVKSRWHLSVDSTERRALVTTLSTCQSMAVEKPAAPKLAALVAKSAPRTGGGSKGSGTSTGTGTSTGGSSSVYYANCTAVRAAGAAPLRRGQPGYETPRLDRDGDGVACE